MHDSLYKKNAYFGFLEAADFVSSLTRKFWIFGGRKFSSLTRKFWKSKIFENTNSKIFENNFRVVKPKKRPDGNPEK